MSQVGGWHCSRVYPNEAADKGLLPAFHMWREGSQVPVTSVSFPHWQLKMGLSEALLCVQRSHLGLRVTFITGMRREPLPMKRSASEEWQSPYHWSLVTLLGAAGPGDSDFDTHRLLHCWLWPQQLQLSRDTMLIWINFTMEITWVSLGTLPNRQQTLHSHFHGRKRKPDSSSQVPDVKEGLMAL